MRRRRYRALAALALVVAASAGWFTLREPDFSRVPVPSLDSLKQELESLRGRLRIPGMSAAVAENDRIIWARGFGMANRERSVAAGLDTIYHLASLTKPFGSTIILQLVEEGRVSLDDLVSRFDITVESQAPVKVWHLLSHTSGDPPGAAYRYDGNAFGTLTQVVERSTGQPFAKELTNRIIRPIGSSRTAPNPGDPRGFWSVIASLSVNADDIERGRAKFAASGIEREHIEAGLAQGYARSWGRWLWPTGLLALESSALLVKIPQHRLTFVVVANSDGLSRWRGLGDKADVTASPAATLFLNWPQERSNR